MHLTEAEFWGLTLRQYSTLVAEWREAELRKDWRSGQLLSLLANVNRNPETHPWPFSPHDFYPDLPEPPEIEQSEQDQANLASFLGLS